MFISVICTIFLMHYKKVYNHKHGVVDGAIIINEFPENILVLC